MAINSGAIAAAVGGLGFARGLEFEFRPSVGILASRLNTLGMQLESFKDPLTRAVKEVMIPSIRENFDVEGRPAWAPLQPFTVTQRGGSAGPILNRTGQLKSDATSERIWHITDKAASIQSWPSTSWYGAIHQAGYLGKFEIPARPFVMIQSEDEDDIRLIFMEWLEEKALEWGRL